MVTTPSLPIYDRAKDGNPYQWIIQTAQSVRESREVIERLGIPNQKRIKPSRKK